MQANDKGAGRTPRPLLIDIAIPNRDDFKGEMVATLFQVATLRQYQFRLFQMQTTFIDEARNAAFEDARAVGADYLFFLDTDVSVEIEGDVLTPLIEAGRDIMTGVYYQHSYPYYPVVYMFSERGLIRNFGRIPEELFRVDATGAGFLLISKKVINAFTPQVIRDLGRPFDFWHYGQPDMLREDAAFCLRAKKLGLEIWADPSIPLAHVGKQKMTSRHWEAAKQHNQANLDRVEKGIPGWMSEKELAFLAETAKQMGSIVELGSHKGRSSDVLLSNCPGEVYCVDLWDGKTEFGDMAERIPVYDGNEVYKEFVGNVGHYENLHPIRSDSVAASYQFKDKSVDMVFIDADHSYQGCAADINAWLPKVRKIIAGHDYSPAWQGVVKAVSERFERVHLVDTIWYVDLEEEKTL